MDDLPTRLAHHLAQPLPAGAAWSRFAPELTYGRHSGPREHDAQQAAVIALLFPEKDDWVIPLTLRPSHMAAHAGQVCLPGGVLEPNESHEQAAIRELREELATCPDDLQILGRLSPIYVFGTNFYVSPFVAATKSRPSFQPNPHEVEEVVELPLSVLCDRRNHGSHAISRGPLCFQVPHILCNGHRIWGATSMMLAELMMVVSAAQRK